LYGHLAGRKLLAAAPAQVPVERAGYEAGTRYLAWVAGLIQLLVGLAMVVTPAEFQDAAYDAVESRLAVYGFLLCTSGLALLSWQVLPLERANLPKASLLLGALSSGLLCAGFIRTEVWTGAATFGLFAVGLTFAAEGAESRLRRRFDFDLFILLASLDGFAAGLAVWLFSSRVSEPAYAAMRLHPQRWLAGSLFIGASLTLWQLKSDRLWRVVFSTLGGSMLLAAAFQLGVRGNLMVSLITGGMLGAGVLARPLFPPRWFGAPRDRIANRIVAVFVASVSVALVVLVALVLRQTDSAYQGRAEQDLSETARVVAHDSSAFVEGRLRQDTIYSRAPAIMSFDPATQLAFIQRTMQGEPAISQVSIVNQAGLTVLRSTGEQPNEDDRAASPGLTAILATHRPNWTVENSPRRGVPVLEVRVPILAADGSFNGVYVSQVRLSILTQMLADLPLETGERVVIVDSSGHVISNPDPGLVASRADLSALPPVRAALAGHPAPMVYRDGNQRWISVQAIEPDPGWAVLVEQPQAIVLAPVDLARERVLVALALTLLLVAGAAVLLARNLSRPVVELAKAAKMFGETSVFPQLPDAGSDEMGDLVRAFREMGERLAAEGQERDRVAEILRESEERYRGIVETAEEGIWMLDAAAETTFANAKLAEMLKCRVAEMQGASLFSFVDATDQSTARAGLERWRLGIAGQQELKLRQQDGGELWVLVSANPLHDHAGNFAGAVAMVTNVTMRRRVEQERAALLLREQAAREEVEALLAATASLGVQAEPDEVLRTLVLQAARMLDAQSAAYAIRKGGALVVEGRWVDDQWVHAPYALPVADSIFGHVWNTGVPYRSNDMESDPFVNLERLATTGHTSMLAVPLLGPDRMQLGCVATFDSRRVDGFTDRDERLLVAICETGAAVLLRARDVTARLEAERAAARSKQEVEALLSAAGRLNSAVDPEEVLLSVVGVAAEVLAVARVSITTNEGTHALRRHTWLDGAWHSTRLRMPLEGSLTGWVITNAKPYRTDDFRGGPISYGPATFEHVPQTALAVPILAGDGRVLGTLNLFDRLDSQPFTDEDQRVAEGIAHHAAVALERATLTAELRRGQKQLKHQAFSDALTGLPNRPLFLDRLAHGLAVARRTGGGLAVLFMDLDGFKLVNDSLGHAAGDALLIALADRIAKTQRAGDTVARFGGDEFAVLLEGCTTAGDATRAAERIITELRRPFRFESREIIVTGSVGISLSDGSSGQARPEDLLREADIALYQAKAAGKAQAVVFDPKMSAQALERLDLETHLRRAVDNGELVLHYQPVVDLRDGNVVAAEALVRWQHPERGLLAPDTFIRLAEETGIIVSIGKWVLEEACRRARLWRGRGPRGGHLRMCVNLSTRQFEQQDLAAQVRSALREADIEAEELELEITESAVIENTDATMGTLRQLKEIGVRLAIDDFGTGYSSLSYLQRLSVDTLKIDRSFINGLRREQSSQAIVQAVVAMAHTLEIDVTAEGIETAEQFDLVRVLGCDLGQGFFLSQPVPAEEFEALFADALPA